jgi:cytochrome oxidase Cu insertion factor (SCO1/SenC/PrrC family)
MLEYWVTATADQVEKMRMNRQISRGLRLLLLTLLMLFPLACSGKAPEGTPIDLEEMRNFEPFTLQTVDGETKYLNDFLGKATLVAFFFPT